MFRVLPFNSDMPKRAAAHVLAPLTLTLLLASCGEHARLPESAGIGPNPQLPPPHETMIPTFKIASAAGWLPGGHPIPAAGLAVNAFAQGLAHPRRPYVLPNGDVLVAETDSPPKPDDEKGLRGFVQNIIKKTVGSDTPSANRISLLRDTNGDGLADVRTVFISGLNSPFGMVLVGNDFYVADTDAVVRFHYATGEIVPDYAMGNHVAALGLTFAAGAKLGPQFADGTFVGEHGSWNRDPLSGYKVVFVPFSGGKPAGMPVDVLTGFLSVDGRAQGRPVGVAIDKSGALLVADDVGNTVWRVTRQ